MSQDPARRPRIVVPIRPDVSPPTPPPGLARRRRLRPAAATGSGGRPLASAGQALGVGLLCFVLWLAFDGQQLFSNADTASPLGTRRNVAMDLLRPIAYVERHLGLDRLVANADRAIGRDNAATPGGAVASVAPPKRVSTPTRRSTAHRGREKGSSRRPHRPTSETSTSKLAFAQPTPAHPVTILDIGDSIGEDLGIGLADEIGQHPDVHLIQTAVGNTGLANPGYYDWPENLARQLAEYHPEIVVVMFGGNDWQPFLTGPNTAAVPGTASWRESYGARVATIIEEAEHAGAKVFWAGLPPMGPDSGLPSAMAPSLNEVYQAEAAAHGAQYVATWSAFTDASGQYATYLANAEGQLVEVRDPDGIHLAPPAGCDLAASVLLKAIDADLDISL